MAGFFDKLNANLTNASRTVSQKVKNSSDASRLMNEITMENKSIQANLNAIGKLYYDICKDEPDEAFREMVEAIARSEQRITELQESIKLIRAREPELVRVPDSGENSFIKPQSNLSSMVCLGCGNTYPEGTVFCSVCGHKLTAQYQSAAAAAAAPPQTAADVQTKPEESEPETVITEAEIIETEAVDIPDTEPAKFCPFCGKQIQFAEQAFCDKCGKAL